MTKLEVLNCIFSNNSSNQTDLFVLISFMNIDFAGSIVRFVLLRLEFANLFRIIELT